MSLAKTGRKEREIRSVDRAINEYLRQEIDEESSGGSMDEMCGWIRGCVGGWGSI